MLSHFLFITLLIVSEYELYVLNEDAPKLENLFRTMNVSTKSNVIFLVEEEAEISRHKTPELHLGLESGVTSMYYHQATFDTTMADLVDRAILDGNMDLYRVLFNFIVICQNDCLADILNRADVLDRVHGKRGLLRHFSKWLFVVSDVRSTEAQTPQTNMDNVAVVYLKDTYQVRTVVKYSKVFLKVNCTSVKSLIWGKTSRYWDVVGEACLHDDLTPILSGMMFPNTQRGLNGRELMVGVLEWLPFCQKIPNKHKLKFNLTCKDFFNSLGRALNYRFIEPADRTWGMRTVNNTWTGLLGMAARDEVDVVGIPYGTTAERSTVMSFTVPFIRTSYRIDYRKMIFDDTWSVLVNPFAKEVYIWGILSLMFIVVLYTLLEINHHDPPKRTEPSFFTYLMDVVQTPISALLRQGTYIWPRSLSARILFSFWWLFCIVITIVYTGNLMAFIAIKKDSVPFRTLAELVTNKDYKIVMQTGTLLETTMKTTSDPVLKAVYKKIIEARVKLMDYTEEYNRHVHLLLSGGYAYLEIDMTLDSIDTKGIDLTRMKRDILMVTMQLPFPKNSPLLGLFSEKISLLNENGIVERWKRSWYPPKKIASGAKTQIVQLPLRKLSSCLVTCACGVFLGTCVLGIEYAMSKHKPCSTSAMTRRTTNPTA